MAKENKISILQCPNPSCGKPIWDDHADSWCIECGERFTRDFQQKIPLLKAKIDARLERELNTQEMGSGGIDGKEIIEGHLPRSRDAVVNRYRNAYRVAAALVGLGTAIKIVGAILGVIILIGALQAGGQVVLPGIVIAAGVGIQFWVVSVIVEAAGEILRATLDSAVANSPFLSDHERLDAMGIPRSIADRSTEARSSRVLEHSKPEMVCQTCSSYLTNDWDQSTGKCMQHQRMTKATDSCEEHTLNPSTA